MKEDDKKSLEIQIKELSDLVKELHAKVDRMDEEDRPPCKETHWRERACYVCLACMCWPCLPCRACRLCFACRTCKK